MRHLRILLCLLGLAAAVAPLRAQREPLPPDDLATVQKQWPDAKRTVTGLRYVITEPGTGEPAAPGDMVSVNYKGMLLDGKVFDQAPKLPERPDPFTFRLGRGQVIQGWDQGIKLMRLGSKMTLIVPYELGYGTRGDPPKIPRRATLVFEVEMVKIERAEPMHSQLPPVVDPKKKKK
ncbi:MAG: FKBP-type peptidyl-prolyl cis-trans isomerase [Opitutae bacterium]|nr:FKBP-type peptidyl-prolyl cis-trans isomerase [Opitutae bacterium]